MRDSVHLIIGGGGGIGSCVARQISAAGGRVAVMGRDPERLQPLVSELDAKAISGDATDFDAVASAVKDVADWGGRLDGVLNCAGSILLKPAHLTTEAEFAQTIATNLTSSFAAVKASVGVMRKTGGSIVLMSTAAVRIGLANHEAIAAAKGGVEGLTRAAAATYAAHGVRVNAVAPGLVKTPLSEKITSNAKALEASTAMHPLGRVGEPEDVASAICWLLDPSSGWVTGQLIGVDGGLSTLKTRSRA